MVAKKKVANKLLRTYFCSYVLVMLVPIVMVITVYFYFNHSLVKQARESNIAMLQQAQRVLDERFTAIQQLSLNLSFNSRVQELLTSAQPLNNYDYYTISKIVRDIGQIANVNTFSDNIFLYLKNSDTIIYQTGIYDPKLFFEEVIPFTGYNYGQWHEMLGCSYNRYFAPLQRIGNALNGRQVLPYYQSLPISMQSMSKGTAVVLIDKSKIESLFNNTYFLHNGSIYLVNPQNEVIMSMGNTQKYEINIQQILDGTKDTTSSEFGDAIVSSIFSPSSRIRYVAVVSRSIITEKIREINIIVLAYFAIMLIISLLLSYWLANRNSMPIERIAERMKSVLKSEANISNESNYIRFIEDTTMTAINENMRITQNINKIRPMLRNNLFIQLISWNVSDMNELFDILQSNGIEIKHKYYCVCIININDYSGFSCETTLREHTMVKQTITNVMEEFANQIGDAYMMDLDRNRMGLLINMSNNTPGTYAQLKSRIKMAVEFLDRECYVQINVGMGDMCDDLTQLGESYIQASNFLDYKLFSHESRVIGTDDIRRENYEYAYPIETEIYLINCLKSGDIEAVEKVLKEIFMQNVYGKGYTPELANCLFYNIASSAVRIVDKLDPEVKEGLYRRHHFFDELLDCKTIDDMYKVLLNIFTELCRLINNSKKSHNEKLKELIIEYVSQHYSEYNISLATAADSLSMNYTYLSHFFKEQFGENFVDYLRNLRVEVAKRQLIDTDLTLQSIANNIGYANSGVLISAFKKSTGITPGQYRDANRGYSQ